MEHSMMCPQCGAPLTVHKFAQSTVCSYCGATIRLGETVIPANRFHKAFQAWNSPQSYQFASWFSIGESFWAFDRLLAKGDLSDVYTGQRARWPTELAVIKLLRDRQHKGLFDNEWEVLQALQRSNAPGADTFTALIPEPILHGDITSGSNTGQRVSIYRWASGFTHTFDEVIQNYPQGISPRASIWIWRRILEVLSFLHNSGMAHGAVLPSHLLIQENEHGVRLVGYGAAGRLGEKLWTVSDRYEYFYPGSARARSSLSAQLDLMMSARCVIAILGGSPENCSLPKTVPARLAGLIEQVAKTEPGSSTRETAWSIREELGAIAREVFGAPQFIPIAMPP